MRKRNVFRLAFAWAKLQIVSMLMQIIMAGLMAGGATQSETSEESEPTPMQCDVGPVTKTFGGNEWLIYSCDDGVSMVAITPQSNPASPFIFILSAEDEGYRIYGEGNGDRAASTAAGDELSALSPVELSALLAETKVAGGNSEN